MDIRVSGHQIDTGSALQEQHLVVGRNCQQRAQIGFRLLGDGDEGLAAMAHFHHRHAAAAPIQQLLSDLLQHHFRQRGRTRTEVINP